MKRQDVKIARGPVHVQRLRKPRAKDNKFILGQGVKQRFVLGQFCHANRNKIGISLFSFIFLIGKKGKGTAYVFKIV